MVQECLALVKLCPVCFIQEVGREKVQAGETFSAAYIIGFFDSIEEMEKVYDQHYGWSNIAVEPSFAEAETFSGVI